MQSFCTIPVTSQRSNSGKVVGPNSLWTVFYFEPTEEMADITESENFDDFYAQVDKFKVRLDRSFALLTQEISERMHALTNRVTVGDTFDQLQKEMLGLFKGCSKVRVRTMLDDFRQQYKGELGAQEPISSNTRELFTQLKALKSIQLFEMILTYLFDTERVEQALDYMAQEYSLFPGLSAKYKEGRDIFTLLSEGTPGMPFGLKRRALSPMPVHKKPILRPPEKPSPKAEKPKYVPV